MEQKEKLVLFLINAEPGIRVFIHLLSILKRLVTVDSEAVSIPAPPHAAKS
jgi:hypothetical protein